MPRPGSARHGISSAVAAVGASVFSPLAERVARHPGPLFPLNVGDTWREPCVGARMEDLRVEARPGMHRYSEPTGIPPLVEEIVEKVRSRNGLPCEPESVLVTAGATGALACAVSALTDPGEEVLILAPFWPLIRGIVRAQRARPVEVPFYDRVESARDAVAALDARASARTVALYVSTPSNPTGRVIPAPWLEALASWARRRDLWILSDEVYEDFVYRGEHVSIGRFAPERTLTVWSFSKAYGLAGNRVGYLTGPAHAVAEAGKVQVHTVYHPPTAGQLAALAALRSGRAWLAEVREAYRRVGEDAARVLGLPPPEGSCFLFLDVRPRLEGRNLLDFLQECLDRGVVLASGASSGEDYDGFVRLCYTSAPPDEVGEAVRRLADCLGVAPQALDVPGGVHTVAPVSTTSIAPGPWARGEEEKRAMKIRPLHDRVLVKRIEEEEKTKGGIIIPDTAKEKPQEGKVVAVGGGKVNEEGKVTPLDVKKGDRILFSKYAGTEVNLDGEEHLIVREDDVLAILE